MSCDRCTRLPLTTGKAERRMDEIRCATVEMWRAHVVNWGKFGGERLKLPKHLCSLRPFPLIHSRADGRIGSDGGMVGVREECGDGKS